VTSDLIVPSRFRGPARSGNGGWTCGALAELVEACPTDHAQRWPTVEVTLRKPPPLDVSITVVADATTAVCEVAGATTVTRRITRVAAVGVEEAAAAEAAYPGLRQHPFPTCFSCGPGRDEGDGLRIFPGLVRDSEAGRQRVAATWTPHPSVAEDFHTYVGPRVRAAVPVTWAALDCIGGWAGDLEERPMVLGRMTTAVESLPVVGERHVVVGELLGADGRKTFTAATLYDSDGTALAAAEHVWITVDPAAFN
jgi:hypothetical protein